MFGVVGSGFAMFLAFVIFVVFSSYREAEGNAASEAVAVRQMFRTADLFEAADEAALRADLVCYARSVIGLEWEAMESQTDSDVVDLWLDGFERTLASANVAEPRAQIALGHWLAQTAIRQEGRRGRISEASPVIAPFVWVALFIIGFIVIGFMVLFADRREHVLVQGFMIVSVTTMVVAGLAVVAFLDRPYGDHGGSVEPEAMERTRESMEMTLNADGVALVRCDALGAPLADA